MRMGIQSIKGPISKPTIFGLVIALVIGVTTPLLVPHFGHPSMIYHVTLHMVSISIAIFLSIVSILAYARNTNARLLFMMLGFLALAVVECFYLLDATEALPLLDIPATDIELSHMVLLIMLTMFGLGVLRVNK